MGDARRAFNGLCVAMVQATKQPGELVVEAASPGLVAARLVIGCDPKAPRAAVP
jgi:beta-galactosidase